jgi:hypothetical protein
MASSSSGLYTAKREASHAPHLQYPLLYTRGVSTILISYNRNLWRNQATRCLTFSFLQSQIAKQKFSKNSICVIGIQGKTDTVLRFHNIVEILVMISRKSYLRYHRYFPQRWSLMKNLWVPKALWHSLFNNQLIMAIRLILFKHNRFAKELQMNFSKSLLGCSMFSGKVSQFLSLFCLIPSAVFTV